MTEQERAAALVDEECTLNNCPPGLFLFRGRVYFKSEYRTQTTDGGYQVDAYCIDSGEYFWGGAASSEARGMLIVRPVSSDALHLLAATTAALSVVTDEMVEAMTRRQFEMDWDGKYGEPSQPTERRWHLTKAAYRARVEAVLSDLGISTALKKEPTNV